MIKRGINMALRPLGYEIQKIHPTPAFTPPQTPRLPPPPPLDPVWPLPRRGAGFSDEQIRQKFAQFDLWHYAYEFEGGISFSARHNNPSPVIDIPQRPLQRFRHFFPYLLASQGGALKDKRVLDIACNSGFWSLQCALLGAEVVGFDSRPELIEQANLIKSIVGADNAQFRVLDFWDMNPQTLGGAFDVVLNLGILYHLPKPLEALELTKAMTQNTILLDSSLLRRPDPLVRLQWEEPDDIRRAGNAGMVAYPTKSAVELMLRHIGVAQWWEIPLRTRDMPPDYLNHKRASWLIKV